MQKIKIFSVMMLVFVMLSGCNLLSTKVDKAVGNLPSVKHCDKVNYSRDGRDVVINAMCVLPPADAGGLGLTEMI